MKLVSASSQCASIERKNFFAVNHQEVDPDWLASLCSISFFFN